MKRATRKKGHPFVLLKSRVKALQRENKLFRPKARIILILRNIQEYPSDQSPGLPDTRALKSVLPPVLTFVATSLGSGYLLYQQIGPPNLHFDPPLPAMNRDLDIPIKTEEEIGFGSQSV